MAGRRREDPRPPIEVLGAAPPEEATTPVTVGGGPGRRVRLLLVVVAVVAVLVASGVVLDGGDGGGGDREDEAASATSTTRRTPRTSRPASTSTAPSTTEATVPHGPVLPVATGGAVLVGGYDGERWVHLDLDTGARTVLRVRLGEVLPPAAVRGGVVASTGYEVVYRPLPAGDAVPLGPGSEVHAASPDAVWIVEGDDPRGELDEPRSARLVEVPSGRRRSAPLPVPPDAYAVGATGRGLVLAAGGRTYLLEPDGGITPLLDGDAHAAAGTSVVVNRCDERARCGLWLLDVATGEARPLQGLPALSSSFGRSAFLAPDGRVAVATYRPDGVQLWFSGDGDPTRGTVHDLAGHLDPGGWLPGGEGFLAVGSAREAVVRYTVEGGELVEHPVEALAEDRAGFVLVIPG